MNRSTRIVLSCATAASWLVSAAASPAAAASPGLKLWTRYSNGPASGVHDAVAITTNGAAVFVTGVTSGATSGLDFFTIAYAADSSLRLWGDRYDGPPHLDDTPSDIAVTPDGSTVFVTGYSTSANQTVSSDQFAVIAYDASTGARRWTKRIGGDATYEEPLALAVAPDGSTVYITGTRRGTTDSDIPTIALDAGTGAVQWKAKFEGGQRRPSFGLDIHVAPDGSAVFVVGTVENATDASKSITLAYDAAGTKLWVQRFDRDTSSEDRGLSLEVSPNGAAVYASIASEGAGGTSARFDYVTIGYDATTGTELWTNTFDGPGHTTDQPSAIAVNPNGSLVYVTGRSVPATSFNYDYATLAIDTATGARVWVKRYDESKDVNEDSDEAVDIGVTPDGSKVFVTGTSQGFESGASTYEDIATQGYDAITGAKLGLREHDSCEYRDLARGLSLSPDGSRLFVLGTVYCPEVAGAMATLAYPT